MDEQRLAGGDTTDHRDPTSQDCSRNFPRPVRRAGI
jgi:hypothetical protein